MKQWQKSIKKSINQQKNGILVSSGTISNRNPNTHVNGFLKEEKRGRQKKIFE